MPQRILAIRLVPPQAFAAVLTELRRRYPGCEITSVAGSDDGAGADDHIDWRRVSGRSLPALLRSRRFDLIIVPHGRDQYGTAPYWKATALAAVSGAGSAAFCEDGRWPGRGLIATAMAGVLLGMLRLGQEACAAVLSLLILLTVLTMAAVGDLTEAVGGIGRTGGRVKTR
jgi:hypothetical protein